MVLHLELTPTLSLISDTVTHVCGDTMTCAKITHSGPFVTRVSHVGKTKGLPRNTLGVEHFSVNTLKS